MLKLFAVILFTCKTMYNKTIVRFVFAISGIIKVSVSVIRDLDLLCVYVCVSNSGRIIAGESIMLEWSSEVCCNVHKNVAFNLLTRYH